MSKSFGKARGQGCECTQRFTCGACLRNAPSYRFTPGPAPFGHAAHAAAAGVAVPCTAAHQNYGGHCLNCGYRAPLC